MLDAPPRQRHHADATQMKSKAEKEMLAFRANSRMKKAFVSNWKPRNAPNNHGVDVWFTSNPDSALHWPTKQEAHVVCFIFGRFRITLLSATGTEHDCRDFKIQKLNPRRFVVFCELPPTYQPL